MLASCYKVRGDIFKKQNYCYVITPIPGRVSTAFLEILQNLLREKIWNWMSTSMCGGDIYMVLTEGGPTLQSPAYKFRLECVYYPGTRLKVPRDIQQYL